MEDAGHRTDRRGESIRQETTGRRVMSATRQPIIFGKKPEWFKVRKQHSENYVALKHLVHGDLGQSSLTHQAVTHDLGQFIPATAELALYSILLAAGVLAS